MHNVRYCDMIKQPIYYVALNIYKYKSVTIFFEFLLSFFHLFGLPLLSPFLLLLLLLLLSASLVFFRASLVVFLLYFSFLLLLSTSSLVSLFILPLHSFL